MYRRLSYTLNTRDHAFPGAPTLRLEPFESMKKGDRLNTYNVTLFNHFGTHMDGPNHFYGRGKQLYELELSTFIFERPLLVDIPKGAGELVEPEELLAFDEQILRLFRLMFSEGDNGQMNQLMHLLGNASIPWLKEKTTGWIALLLLCMWRWTGVNMLYFISGLKSIDTSLYESADIDGANAKQKFWYLTLPLLKPTTIYVITISVYAGLSMFLESFMLWNGNSSPKNIGLTIVGYLYKRGIEKNDMGYACAVGMVLLVIALAINIIQLVATGTFKKEEE